MELDEEVLALLTNWWEARGASAARLERSGLSNTGAQARDARHMQRPAAFIRQMFLDAGLAEHEVMLDTSIPGYYRRSKNWDVVAVHKGRLVGVVELKSQETSPGNNANNRIEEALGSAVDAQAVNDISGAYGELPLWAAWCMIFNHACESGRPVGLRGRVAFDLDAEFTPMTYASQYASAIQRMVAQNVYQAGWMVETWMDPRGGVGYREPVPTATAETMWTNIEYRVRYAKESLKLA